MAIIKIEDLRKSYGTQKVIHGVSLDVQDGEFVAVVGPSGCGKSTLLRMVAGLESITGGTVSIGDRVVNDLAPRERDIAMVFQNYALYPHMTVAQNMGFSLRLTKSSKKEFDAAVGRAADILGLRDLLDRYPAQLSGGQRQRVAMGRAIVRSPSVFLFDEPLSNLDAKLRVQMRLEIKALHRRIGTTTLYVTHDQIEAMTMADKVVVMRDGVIEQFGTPLELFDHPANLFVAGFLGSPSMNFVKGVIEVPHTGASVFRLQDGTAIPVGKVADRPGQKVVVGMRPEHVELDPSGFASVVLAVELTGSDTHLVVSLAGEQVAIVIHDRVAATLGDTLGLKIDPGRLHFFDAETGVKIDL